MIKLWWGSGKKRDGLFSHFFSCSDTRISHLTCISPAYVQLVILMVDTQYESVGSAICTAESWQLAMWRMFGRRCREALRVFCSERLPAHGTSQGLVGGRCPSSWCQSPAGDWGQLSLLPRLRVEWCHRASGVANPRTKYRGFYGSTCLHPAVHNQSDLENTEVSEMIQRWSRNGPEMVQRWSRNDPEMIQRWSRNDP